VCARLRIDRRGETADRPLPGARSAFTGDSLGSIYRLARGAGDLARPGGSAGSRNHSRRRIRISPRRSSSPCGRNAACGSTTSCCAAAFWGSVRIAASHAADAASRWMQRELAWPEQDRARTGQRLLQDGNGRRSRVTRLVRRPPTGCRDCRGHGLRRARESAGVMTPPHLPRRLAVHNRQHAGRTEPAAPVTTSIG